MAREGQKVVKLVEAERLNRALPIVSFIARQRDLRELVGEHLPGAEQLGFADVLNHWDARFDKITLEDRNLPAIIQRRVLRPKDAAGARALEEAFAATAQASAGVLETLLTREGDRDMFRQVYPFSPALVSTLVALSSLLQRERTALKLLVQLLVDQRDTLNVGDLVPVGDLYDVIESGDEPFSQAMKLRFDQAKRLYQTKLLPLLEDQHGVSWEDVAGGHAPEDKARVFRGDARLMKTLILASLADGVEALRGLTPTRLAALNHGTVRAPLAGAEGQIVLNKVRLWAARVGEVKVSDDAHNPVISVHVHGVDTDSILENAKGFDNPGNRIRAIQKTLYEMVGLPPDDASLLPPKHRMLWKGTWRECEVLFRNVRELPMESFEPAISGWRLVVDYPFDERTYTPRDDEAKVLDHVQLRPPTRTLVWIPSFLTPQALDDLGRLVVLEHVLAGQKLDEYGAHLSQQDRDQARVLLVNQRDGIRQQVRLMLLAAYGVSTLGQESLDTATAPSSHFHTLEPGLRLQPPVGATFGDALEHLFDQALRYQYPAHPDFESEVRAGALRKVYDVVRRAVAASDGRVEVDRAERDDVRRIAVPLKLGLMGEAHFVLDTTWQTHFEREYAQHGGGQLTMRQLREWINRPHARGISDGLGNLVILTFALQTNRTFYLHGTAFEPGTDRLDRLQDELELREQTLPDEATWAEAKRRAEIVFGIVGSPVRNASGVAKLIDDAQRIAAAHHEALDRYAERLEGRLSFVGLTSAQDPRLQTARAASGLATAVKSARRDNVVRALAEAPVATSEAAMASALKRAGELCTALERTPWDLLREDTPLREPFGAQRAAVVNRVRAALAADEHVTGLSAVLRAAEQDAIRILQEAARTSAAPAGGEEGANARVGTDSTTPPDTSTPAERTRRMTVQAGALEEAFDLVRKDAEGQPQASVELTWRLT